MLEGGRLGCDIEDLLGIAGEGDLVEGEGSEMVEQGAHAVHRQGVRGDLGVGLLFRAIGDLCLLHGGRPFGSCAGAIVVFEQDRGEALAQVPLDVASQGTEEDVGSDVFGAVHVDGPDLEPRHLTISECALDLREGFVRIDGVVGGDGLCRKAGTNDVDAIELRLGGDLVLVARPGEIVV